MQIQKYYVISVGILCQFRVVYDNTIVVKKSFNSTRSPRSFKEVKNIKLHREFNEESGASLVTEIGCFGAVPKLVNITTIC